MICLISFFFFNLDSLGFFWLFETETLLRNLPSSSLLSSLLLETSDFQHPNLFLVQWKNHPCFLMKQTAPSLLLHAIFRGKNISQSYSFGWEHHFMEQLQCKEHTDWQSLIFIYLLHSIDWRSQILRSTNLFSFSCWLFINVLSLALLRAGMWDLEKGNYLQQKGTVTKNTQITINIHWHMSFYYMYI